MPRANSVPSRNPHDIPGAKISFAARDTGRQEAFASFAQGLLCSLINKERAFGMMKESNPPFAALEPSGLGNENRPFLRPLQDASENGLLFAGGDDHRDAGAHDNPGGLDFRRHAADGQDAVGAPGHSLQLMIDLIDSGNGFGICLAKIFDHAIDRREDNQEVRRQQRSNQRGEPVVVAEP